MGSRLDDDLELIILPLAHCLVLSPQHCFWFLARGRSFILRIFVPKQICAGLWRMLSSACHFAFGMLSRARDKPCMLCDGRAIGGGGSMADLSSAALQLAEKHTVQKIVLRVINSNPG